MHVGQIIHKLRKEKRMTLVELSRRSGVAVATLSRMENGIMTGTLDSHMGIAKALEVHLTDIYKDLSPAKESIEIQSRRKRSDIFVHDKTSSAEILVSKVLSKKMMPVLIRIAKDGKTHEEETKPGVERFIYVVSGKVEAVIGDERYQLGESDTLYFESSIPHHFKNTGSQEASIICVTAPPVL